LYLLWMHMSGAMDAGPTLWLVMTLGGTALLGLAMAYGVISTRRRRENAVAQRATNVGTREVYRDEEERRAHIEEGGEPIVGHSGRDTVTVTQARQGVVGHNVSAVLMVSLFLAILAGIGLFGYLWL
jgi:hypothetical protein